MRKLNLLLPAILLAVNASAADAANKRTNPADLIPGLGESVPAGVKNISLSPKFKAYKFSKDGLDYVQVNSLKDEVLSVTIVTPGVQSTLPIGRAAETTMAVVSDDKQQPMGMVTAAATCPCSSQVIYDDATTRIVVIYGANGEYIQTVVIDKRTPSIPRPNT
ncbi:hypothetical protein [Xanthomonas rydalmerensis]|uniref:Uncharacterized protein n=1 Tax=Xanthomonas rydalmerensis TaxID=3046274 RepID=A0ABZ0JNP6_9XANT|nr:hypothetical protein [Xanthomonas sp. DM-2023]WOS40665.1 hypothetical protein QN243_20105 [Xanthomonas sp. DM-2023]WOS44849.1 hypothetical protein QN242_20105 [Xanthomonas sp. DM-2023]WOS49029.1 hypothetical protein QN240_20105 [Xanthomonas sp. DM-2023]WOS53209.1 hypothetical protein QN244_20110 [Xanthomonas sp. DM-2023]WOS57392.1 hypothetical protein QN245_20105 [Xanthomonas sp. DM-2023]